MRRRGLRRCGMGWSCGRRRRRMSGGGLFNRMRRGGFMGRNRMLDRHGMFWRCMRWRRMFWTRCRRFMRRSPVRDRGFMGWWRMLDRMRYRSLVARGLVARRLRHGIVFGWMFGAGGMRRDDARTGELAGTGGRGDRRMPGICLRGERRVLGGG